MSEVIELLEKARKGSDLIGSANNRWRFWFDAAMKAREPHGEVLLKFRDMAKRTRFDFAINHALEYAKKNNL